MGITNMKVFFVLALAVAATQAINYDAEWEMFKFKYERNYLSTPEHDNRKNVFISNLKLIQKHNAEHALGPHTFALGVNKFADLTSEEFVSTYNGYQAEAFEGLPKVNIESIGNEPESVDWRDEGYVTPVKDQGQCGSCWAFSAVATMEGAWFKKSGELGASFTSVVEVESKSEAALKTATATQGPISVGIDASHFSFQLYSHGVYHASMCSSTRLDHGVTVVGYGAEDGKDYLLVKNSWGTGWGEHGYIKMSRNRNNNCGIATMAVYAVA